MFSMGPFRWNGEGQGRSQRWKAEDQNPGGRRGPGNEECQATSAPARRCLAPKKKGMVYGRYSIIGRFPEMGVPLVIIHF